MQLEPSEIVQVEATNLVHITELKKKRWTRRNIGQLRLIHQ